MRPSFLAVPALLVLLATTAAGKGQADAQGDAAPASADILRVEAVLTPANINVTVSVAGDVDPAGITYACAVGATASSASGPVHIYMIALGPTGFHAVLLGEEGFEDSTEAPTTGSAHSGHDVRFVVTRIDDSDRSTWTVTCETENGFESDEDDETEQMFVSIAGEGSGGKSPGLSAFLVLVALGAATLRGLERRRHGHG